MLLSGDEMGRSQGGNNNAYCQDNPLTWIDWNLPEENEALLDFTQQLIELRRQHPVFRRRKWFQGRAIHGSEVHDIVWFNADGTEMTEAQWQEGSIKSIAIFLNGEEIVTPNQQGERVIDDSFLLLFNADHTALDFSIPPEMQIWEWRVLIDTTKPRFIRRGKRYRHADRIIVAARSFMMLQRLGRLTATTET